MTQKSYYKSKVPWPDVPDVLEICQDAQQIGTTYERLAKHLVTHHRVESWVVEGRTQTELELMHDQGHQKTAARPANHKHAKPVRIVGYEIKDEPPPPAKHNFMFKNAELAKAFVMGLGIFGVVENFLVFPKGMRSPVVPDEARGHWVVTIKGHIPGYENCIPDTNNEFWHEQTS
jgi:hypothetical protein